MEQYYKQIKCGFTVRGPIPWSGDSVVFRDTQEKICEIVHDITRICYDVTKSIYEYPQIPNDEACCGCGKILEYDKMFIVPLCDCPDNKTFTGFKDNYEPTPQCGNKLYHILCFRLAIRYGKNISYNS